MTSQSRTEAAWLNQPGRMSSRTGSLADGYRGTGSFAGVIVVAEAHPDRTEQVSCAVAAVRDAFAEGVAYGAGDLLKDVLDEVEDTFAAVELSIAAAAFVGNELWVSSRGSCRAFIAGKGNEGSLADGTLVGVGTVDTVRLGSGQSVVLVSHGLARLAGSGAAGIITGKCRDPLSDCLRKMVEETRIRFGRAGGSAAALRYCSIRRLVPPLPWRGMLLALLSAVLLVLLLKVLCRERSEPQQGPGQSPLDSSGTVMPLQ